jgi:DNA-binding GntR family transcriptional regulator
MATAASEIVDRIRADLDAGAWAPGETLRQEELAERYGASRMPVREALLQLHSEGLISMQPNRGAVVVQLAESDVIEIFDLRYQIEAYLLAHAIPRHNAKSLGRVEATQQELEVEDSRAGWLDGDKRFHARLYEPAAKPRAMAMATMLRAQVERYGLQLLSPDSRRPAWAREHGELIAAARRNDVAAGIKALESHLRQTQAEVLNRIGAKAAMGKAKQEPKPGLE